jgi:hypothetical protein
VQVPLPADFAQEPATAGQAAALATVKVQAVAWQHERH